MNAPFRLLVVGFLSSGLLAGCRDRQRLSPLAALERVGRVERVCGTVVDFSCSTPDRTTRLTLDTPDGVPAFNVAIAQADRGHFGLRVEDRYYAQHICVTGTIEAEREGMRIVVRRPDQVAIEGGFRPAELHPPGDVYRPCDVGVGPSKKIRDVQPHYTPAALLAKTQGTVKLQGVIGTDGSVHNIQMLKSLDPLELDVEAARAFSQWQFTPAIRYGKAVPVIFMAYVTFSLVDR